MRKLFYILLSLPILFAACGKKSMVLDKEDMASLMADIHIAEAVVDVNSAMFPTDSSRQALKQTIYKAHGVTSEQVDSSFIWYGYHIEDYMEVYDRTIEIIKERQRDMLTASSQQVVVAGDSVDIWPMAPKMEFSQRSPSRILTFSIPADSNWRHHDVFSLRFNIASAKVAPIARMNVEYADGTTYFNLEAGRTRGEGEVSVRIDSALQPVRIVGYIMASPEKGETVLLDSIALVRMREYVPSRYFTMRQFKYGAVAQRQLPHLQDSTATDNRPASSVNNYHLNAANSPQNSANTPTRNPRGHTSHGSVAPTQSGARPTQQAPASSGGGSTAQEALRQRNELLRQSQKR